MKSLKTLWHLLAVLLIVTLVLGACQPEEATETPAVEVEREEPTETEMEEGEEVAVEEMDLQGAAAPLNADVSGEVEFWHFWGSPVRRTAIRRAIAICTEKLPNITVEEVFKPWGDIWTANIAAVAAGSGMPDVIVEDRPKLQQRARDEVVENLQPYIDRDNLDPEQFWDFTWEETLYEENSYGVPFETDVRVLFWNKQLFEQAGLDPEQPPETWDDLLEYADALDVQNEDGSYERIAFFPLWSVGPDLWALTNGHDMVQDGQPVVDDPQMVETLRWTKDWIDRYGGWQELQNYRARYSAPPNDLFMSGAVAMLVDISGYHSVLSFYRPSVELENGETPRMEWGIAPIPYREEHADWSGGFALSVPRGAENPDAAWELIKCLTGPEAQMSWTRDTSSIPTNEEAARHPVLMADPYWEAIIENMQWSQGSEYVSEYPNWGEQLWQRYEAIWTGEMKPAEAMEEAQEAINEVMAQNE
ncbi:MAG: ABC transporter substrate-binding protein [Anaerolineales bacterium]